MVAAVWCSPGQFKRAAHSLQGPSAVQAAPAPHEEALHPDAGIAKQLDLAEPKQ